jgi:FdhD protein
MAETYYLIDCSSVCENTCKQQEKLITIEHSVSLTVNGKVWVSLECTPNDLEALALGYLFNHSVIENADEVACIYVCQHMTNIDVWLNHKAEKPQRFEQTSLINTSTGDHFAKDDIPLRSHLDMDMLYKQFIKSRNSSKGTLKGIYFSVLHDGNKILAEVSDINKDQTLDKLAGQCLLQTLKVKDGILMTSAHINGEMVEKAVRMGVSLIISLNAASSLALQYAKTFGIKVIGDVHPNHYTIYI